MFFVCNKCHRYFRAVNTTKHINKCRGTTFNCSDCMDEFRIQDIPGHINCVNSIKTLAPALFNPKSVIIDNYNTNK